MANFPRVRFGNLNTWIPSTDIDGIDAKTDFVEDLVNIAFRNGYIENIPAKEFPEEYATAYTSVLDNEYTLISAKYFTHSNRKGALFTVFYKYDTLTHFLRFFIHEDGGSPIELNIDERNSTLVAGGGADKVAIQSAPENINYNLVNDQLKINLNCTGIYTEIGGKEVILNLNLCYLDRRVYNESETIVREAGWYLFPRWLGWSYNANSNIMDRPMGESTPVVYETVYPELREGTVWRWDLTNLITFYDWVLQYDSVYGWIYTGLEDPEGKYGSIRCTKWDEFFSVSKMVLDYPEKIYLDSFMLRRDPDNNHGITFVNEVRFMVHFGYENYNTEEEFLSNYQQGKYTSVLYARTYPAPTISGLTIEIPAEFKDKKGVVISISFMQYQTGQIFNIYNLIAYQKKMGSTGYIEVGNGIILVKGYDGQRALIDKKIEPNVQGKTLVNISKNEIDWRVVDYEVYNKESSGLFMMSGESLVSNGWGMSGVALSKEIAPIDVAKGVVSLNAKYNLPYNARVDNQRYILSEVEHKGRVYFTTGNDEKIYQSHVSSILNVLADSFPYDEEQGFGYLIINRSEFVKALAVSPTNDMVILTNNSMYAYIVQPSGNSVLRQLRTVSGNIGISSGMSIARSLDGKPSAEGLLWIDNNGIYFYAGGSQAPENLILLTHENYWKLIPPTDKERAVGFYNPLLREYWLQVGSTLLVFELPYRKFKKYDFASSFEVKAYEVTEYVGLKDNAVLILTNTENNKAIWKHRPTNTNKTFANIVSHYNPAFGMDEQNFEGYHKILQEVYVLFGSCTPNSKIKVVLWVDGYSVLYNNVDTFAKFMNMLSPLGTRFHSVKIEVIMDTNDIKIKEFGFTYSPDSRDKLGSFIVPEQEGAGYGFNFGNSYGE